MTALRAEEPLVLTRPAPPPLSNIEVNISLAELWHRDREAALALAEEYSRSRHGR